MEPSEPSSVVENLTDAICQERCEEFALVTDTNTALAQCYLQDRDWNLQVALDDYFNEEKEGVSSTPSVIPIVFAASSSATVSERTGDGPPLKKAKKDDDTKPEETATPSDVLTVISWNIDGLSQSNLRLRTKAVSKIILQCNAPIVFLQEVIPESQTLLEKYLPQYDFLPGGSIGYFNCTLLHRGAVQKVSSRLHIFPSSTMSRNLNIAHVTYKEVPICLINTHLESTTDFADERKKQLRETFELLQSEVDGERETIIFGGDLNLREKELDAIGGIPSGLGDVWLLTGKRPELAYTWDMMRNDNLVWNGRFKPRARFDRLYLGQARPPRLLPTYFGLVGLERLKPHTCFPSDHWGLMASFQILAE